MITPKKEQLLQSNLYELPSCTICLQELSLDIVSLACGHCFHFECISQHFEYKGTCPNCQKRAGSKEVRYVHYPVVKNTKANTHLEHLLSSLNISEKKQVEELLKEIKGQAMKVQKLNGQMEESRKELRKKEEIIENLQATKKENEKKLQQNYISIKQNHQLIEQLESQKKSIESSQIYLRIQVKKYEQEEKAFEEFRKIKKIMNEKTQKLIEYKLKLEKQNTHPEQQARIFFDMTQMKQIENQRLRIEMNDLRQREDQIRMLNKKIEELKNKNNDAQTKRTSQRKKYIELKSKYQALLQKAKLKGMKELQELEDSNGFNNIIKNQQSQKQRNSIGQNQMKLQLPETGFKKPGFALNSMIGGLKKKDDKTKVY